jgi:hypothetical protein
MLAIYSDRPSIPNVNWHSRSNEQVMIRSAAEDVHAEKMHRGCGENAGSTSML